MKKKNKKSKAIWLLPVLLAVSAFVWYGYTQSEFYPGNSEARSVWQPQQYEPAQKIRSEWDDKKGLLTKEQNSVISDFAHCYANTLATLEPVDILHLFADTSGKAYYQNVAAYNVLCEIRKMSSVDLKPKEVLVSYIIEDARFTENKAVVTVTENNIQHFKHLPESSFSYNISHVFELENVGGRWLIAKHEQEEDFFLLAQQAWDKAEGVTNAEKAQSTLNILIADARENIDRLKISTGNPPEDISVKNTAYNREAAVAYAKEWCNKRNYNDVWLAYDEYGGNCQNFASQCIYAGGIDMDYKGYAESQWKFYSQTQNNKQTPYGRSYSWTGVDPFYTYATINRSNGLICQADLALEYAQPGDVVQVGAYGEWRHSLVVTDVMFKDDGSLQDIIVASNTADRWNYPLSAYIYTYPRLIHILGQN